MKNAKIFIYLLAIAVLYIIFQQVNGNKKIKADQQKIEKLQAKIESATKVSDSLENEVLELSYFDLDTLVGANTAENDNPFVPLAGLDGTTKIDRVKLLNHKWAVADFTDGTYWGQVLYLYQITDAKKIKLEVITSHLYSKTK